MQVSPSYRIQSPKNKRAEQRLKTNWKQKCRNGRCLLCLQSTKVIWSEYDQLYTFIQARTSVEKTPSVIKDFQYHQKNFFPSCPKEALVELCWIAIQIRGESCKWLFKRNDACIALNCLAPNLEYMFMLMVLFSSSPRMINRLRTKIFIEFRICFEVIFSSEMFLESLPAFEISFIKNFNTD